MTTHIKYSKFQWLLSQTVQGPRPNFRGLGLLGLGFYIDFGAVVIIW
jgi:hypothetical protein